MAGILDYNKNLFSTQQFRESLLGRNLPPPVNETLTQSGLVSKLQDIGNVINVPIFGTSDENIPVHYNEDERMFPLGTFFRTTKNVNLNIYKPQNDEYITYELTIPPNLGYPLPEGFGEKVSGPYPESYSNSRFFLMSSGVHKGVDFPFNVIDSYKSLNFQNETSLGLVGGQQLETSIIDKISQVEIGSGSDGIGYITEPTGNVVDNFVNKLRGNPSVSNSLPNAAVGWNEYNSSSTSPQGNPDSTEGVGPTMTTEVRMGTLLERTSVTQVQYTFNLLNRNKYRPLYNDRRLQGTSDEGTNSRYYIGTEKNTNRGALITKTFDSSDFNGESTINGQRTTIEGVGEHFGEPNKFFWTTGGEQNFNPKTLLYKTQQLVNNNEDSVFINQTKKFFKDKKQDRLISRGNAISESLLIDAETNGKYCRVWTVNDRYNYRNAIRNTGLFTSPNGTKGFSTSPEKSSLSVLMENGQPKYHPTKLDSEISEIARKKYMLSLENLAWSDNLADLPIGEIGPGDTLTGNKGRIMWFPPYDLKFDETTSASWNATEFIGRSEPVYTYNNSKRSGSLSFKILVDHPRVMNGYRGKSNNLIERFVAGCVTPQDFLNSLDGTVSQATQEELEVKLQEKRNQKAIDLNSKTGGPVDVWFRCEPSKAKINTVNPPPPPVCDADTKIADQNSLTVLKTDLNKYLEEAKNNTNPKVKITINGYGESKKVAKDRAQEIKKDLVDNIGTKNIKYILNEVVGDNDNLSKVVVSWKNDAESSESAQPKKEEKENAAGTYDPEEVKLIDSLLIDENAYFDFIDDNYPSYFKTISEKIKYFQPSFHSITPEGLNSRLTFLNQCMRQGPSIYDKGSDIRPQNLSFGRPPICILRIGDFFYTKIVINSLSITYDGPQFDLNPEGIGVQPMIASVQLSIDLIGGHSLSGPINRLQNALSFNYYANTEMYDPRADSIKEGKIVDGIKLSQIREKNLGKDGLDALVKDLKKQGTVDQKDDANTGNETDADGKDVLEIIYADGKITFKTKTNENPSQIIINKEPDPNNKLYWEIIDISKVVKPEDIPSTDTTIIYGNNFIDPNKIKPLEEKLDTANSELEVAKNDFKTYKTVEYKKAYEEAKIKQKTAEEDLNKEKKGKKDKITAKTWLTENKSKTKVTKTFTITKDGLT